MSGVYVKTGLITPNRRTKDDGWVELRATRDGAPIVMPWYQALCMEGCVFHANANTAMFTGLTLLAHASYADTAKSIFVDVPDGKAALPLEIYFCFLATGAAIVHYASYVSPTLNGVGGTETAITISNMNLQAPQTSSATAAHTADSETDTFAAGAGGEVMLSRFSTSQDLDGVGLDPRVIWRAQESAIAPLLLDGASINVNGSPTTSGTGFGWVNWMEVAESYFT